MAFTVHTSADGDDGPGLKFGDLDSFTISDAGVLIVSSDTYGVRIYSPSFWQLVAFQHHDRNRRPAIHPM